MKNDFWRHLNISTKNAIKLEFEFPEPKKGHGVHWKYKPSDIFTDEWYSNFKANIDLVEEPTIILFYCEKIKTNEYAHIDINEKHNPVTVVPAAFNWVIGGEGSNMVWYNQYGISQDDVWHGVTEDNWKETDPHRRAPRAAIWHTKDLTELARLEVPEDRITLVNTGIAHRIELGPTDRWCFSIRPAFKDTDNWESYIEMSSKVLM